MPAADVVQESVVGFAHHRIDRADRLVARLFQGIFDEGLHRRADAQRVGQDDRSFQFAQFRNLRASGQLSEAIAHIHRRGHLFLKQVAAVRDDGGDAGADVVSFRKRDLADLDAGDIRDGVERAGRTPISTPKSRSRPRSSADVERGSMARIRPRQRVCDGDMNHWPETAADGAEAWRAFSRAAHSRMLRASIYRRASTAQPKAAA